MGNPLRDTYILAMVKAAEEAAKDGRTFPISRALTNPAVPGSIGALYGGSIGALLGALGQGNPLTRLGLTLAYGALGYGVGAGGMEIQRRIIAKADEPDAGLGWKALKWMNPLYAILGERALEGRRRMSTEEDYEKRK